MKFPDNSNIYGNRYKVDKNFKNKILILLIYHCVVTSLEMVTLKINIF